MKRQNGQALIEFALVLPLFLLLVFGVIYSGMLYYDYSTLSNLARTAARERAITENPPDNSELENRYYDKTKGQFKYGLVTSLYKPATDALKITGPENNNPDIVVTVTMELGEDSSYFMRVILPKRYSVVYYMRKDSY